MEGVSLIPRVNVSFVFLVVFSGQMSSSWTELKNRDVSALRTAAVVQVFALYPRFGPSVD